MTATRILIKNLWSHPLARQLDVDAPEAVAIHRQIIESKPLLQRLFLQWYRECLPAVSETKLLGGDMVELGCGAGSLEKLIPGIIKTDVVAHPFADRVMDAQSLEFEDNSLRCIFVIGILHHISEPARFLAEAQRCLKPHGRLVIIEPNSGWVARAISKIGSYYEFFDTFTLSWKNTTQGRMTQANMALPWIIFVRDYAKFQSEFLHLQIRQIRYHTFLSYAVTGGLSYKSFLPSWMAPVVDAIEFLASPWMKTLGTAMTVDIEKII